MTSCTHPRAVSKYMSFGKKLTFTNPARLQVYKNFPVALELEVHIMPL
jgi:hypothetical protein